jgi:hypothetical protein
MDKLFKTENGFLDRMKGLTGYKEGFTGCWR